MVLKNPDKFAPGINIKASFKTAALITKENKPKDKIVIGSDKNFSIGFTNIFKIPSIIASITSVEKESICMLSTN